jgi:outer membrane murein-binding lipoprotein Lpp
MKILIIALSTGLFLAGCSSTPAYKSSAGPYVRPGLVMIPADQAHLYGIPLKGRDEGQVPQNLPVTDSASVLIEVPPTAVQYNRYPDAGDPTMLHEAHIVYRRDAPRWNLKPSAGQQILVGPQITDGRGEVQPIASQELESYLREQRVAAQRQQQFLGQVGQAVGQLATQQQRLAAEVVQMKANGGQTLPLENGPAKEETSEAKPEQRVAPADNPTAVTSPKLN